MKLYENLAADIARLIEQGVMREGEKIPSVRQASQHRNLSVSTVIRAYLLLESRGLIESRPQSGYFVRRRPAAGSEVRNAPEAEAANIAMAPELDVSSLVMTTMRSIRKGSVPFGSPYPDPVLFPSSRLTQYASTFARQHEHWNVMCDLPPGAPELIRQIARRHLENGMSVDSGEIIVTVGATEAINLCLQAVARPGDAIAVEAPAYYAVPQAVRRLGMRVIEIPTRPGTGIDLDGLERAIREHGIAGAIVMPNFQNPLGAAMHDDAKRALVDLMHRHALPIIENDVYHELYYGDSHPSSLKAFDREGLVLHCNSFSKSLSAAYRIGWTLPGRFRAEVEKLKFLSTLATSSMPQLAIAEYLQNDGYDYHLRRLRKFLAQQARMMASAVCRFFPEGTTVSQPEGGYVLWVSLPANVKALELYARAQQRGISIGPGNMFGGGAAFQHHIRLNYSFAWSAEIETAIRTVGQIAGELASRQRRRERVMH